MKNLSSREKKLIVLLSIGVGVYLIYMYVLSPLFDEKSSLEEEIVNLEGQIMDVEMLNTQLEQSENRNKEVLNQINKIDKRKGFGIVHYQDLLTYLGKEAEKSGVDITFFERLHYVDRQEYFEVPFEVKVKGDYKDLILYVDSLYKLDYYLAIDEVDFRSVNMTPMTDLIGSGNSELLEGITFPWAADFIKKLDRNLPSEVINEEGSGNNDNFNFDEYLKKQFKVDEKLELSFKFHFISLEKPNDFEERLEEQKKKEGEMDVEI